MADIEAQRSTGGIEQCHEYFKLAGAKAERMANPDEWRNIPSLGGKFKLAGKANARLPVNEKGGFREFKCSIADADAPCNALDSALEKASGASRAFKRNMQRNKGAA